MEPIYSLMGAPTPFDPTHRFTTSWLLSPTVLASLRLLLSLYAFTTIFFIFGWDRTHHTPYLSRQSFSYFTNLSYWGLAFYFLFSSLHTFSYARTGRAWLQTWPRSLQALHAVFYTTITTFPFLVTIVFWAVIYAGVWFPVRFYAWSNISQHALNSGFALLEILLPRTSPSPPLHILALIVILALYLALAYLTHATQGFYPYGFLDPTRGSGRLAAYICGVLVAACVIFGVVWALVWLRRYLTERVAHLEGKFYRGRKMACGEQDVEMNLVVPK
ncbi:MAG: alpha beta hydrolase fold-1 [Lasallia pustulata]|uniref:Alpha beta hydrolase fold-1 n=1 Tax=Lasallia pustulata TaxID=136370 RepID=A0A5M8Q3D6_9LECA|nr:MAG: alpha beta hydrolase fold-1 [Lasallia pustulata]